MLRGKKVFSGKGAGFRVSTGTRKGEVCERE